MMAGGGMGGAGKKPADPLPYTYNLWRGARRWRDSVGRVRGGAYGVDIVVLGDSTSTYGDVYSSWPHRLKVLLQEKFNNPAVQGGYGFMPFLTYGAGSNGFTFVNAWDQLSAPTGTRPGTGYYEAKSATLGRKIHRQFDGTAATAIANRQQVTDWQYVGMDYPTVCDEVYCDAANAVGVQANSNLVACPGLSQWGGHWTKQTGLTKTNNNVIQIGATATSQGAWANGLILYCGDYSEGVRLHNLSQPGINTRDLRSEYEASYEPVSLFANIDQFCTGANGGSRNAKLFLINSMLNDCGATSEAVTVAQYKANLQILITQAVTRTSKPCVGLIVNQPWGYNTSDAAVATAARLTAYLNYRDAVYQLANENPDTVFVIDFWKDLTYTGYSQYAPHGGDASVGGALTDRGWYNDGTHLLDVGNFARAQMLYGVLSYGLA